MFNSEKKQARKNLEEQIKARKQYLEKLNKAREATIQQYKATHSTQWEYLQLNDEGAGWWSAQYKSVDLDALGRQGWELVSVSTYEKGGGMTNTYNTHALYTFKRKVVDVPEEVIQAINAKYDTKTVTAQIEALEFEWGTL